MSGSARLEIRVLTSLRFFAAVHVVLFHTLSLIGEEHVRLIPAALRTFVSNGAVSVSFFFVLSGFILVHGYVTSSGGLRVSARRFWWGRFCRLYPLYLLGFLLDLPRGVSYFALAGDVGAAKALLSSVAYLTATQAWHPRVATAWNAPGWSISVECFFYVVFPLIVCYGFRLARATQALMLAFALLATILVGRLILYRSDAENHLGFVSFFPLMRLFEFACGCFLGGLWKEILERRAAGRRAWLAVAAVSTGLLVVLLTTVSPELLAQFGPLVAPLFGVCILASATCEVLGERQPSGLVSRLMSLLGRASYALYILHMPVRDWCVVLFELGGGVMDLVVYLAVMGGVAIAAYYFVEEPLRRRLSRFAAE